jgi:polysaccharide export outer membrane protein
VSGAASAAGQNEPGVNNAFVADWTAGDEVTSASIGFRKPQRTDSFASRAPSPFPVATAAQGAQSLKWGAESGGSSGAASAKKLRSAEEQVAPHPTEAASEFRFVRVPTDAGYPLGGPLSHDVSVAGAAPLGETFLFAGGQQPSATGDAAAQDSSLEPPVAPPAPLPNTVPAPLPIAGNATSERPISNGADAAMLPDACPYLPGDSGTPTICGVDCGQCSKPFCADWDDAQRIPWSVFGPGEYVGPARPEHVSSYYLRVNDLVTLTYITSRRRGGERYRIGVGDRLQLEWLQATSPTTPTLDREVLVQPDGTITLPLVGDVIAAGKTVSELREELIRQFGRFQREPQITVTPMEVNTALQDILNAVTSISGSNGQTQALRVTPEGTIQAPGLGSVYVQGLTIEEARAELEARYAATYGPGLMVSPSLTERATSYVFVGGEVQAPGRYVLEGPTTVMQAIAMAGGWNNGGNLRQIVVFRRDENWCLKATKIDVHAPLFGKDPCPTNDVWLRDNDLVIVPKTRILCATDVINLYFTRGVYAAFPISYVYSFSNGSSVTPIVTPAPGP